VVVVLVYRGVRVRIVVLIVVVVVAAVEVEEVGGPRVVDGAERSVLWPGCNVETRVRMNVCRAVFRTLPDNRTGLVMTVDS